MKQAANPVIPVILLTAVLALGGCLTPGAAEKPMSREAAHSAPAAKKPVVQALVTGKVVAPANVIATGGGNLIGQAGGNVIATGGLNVIATGGGNYRTLQASETLISGAEVFLADAGGTPLPLMPAVKSAADGRYTIPSVVAHTTYMVVARFKTADGKTAQLQTLVRPGDQGSTADVSAASSLVTTAVVTGSRKAFGTLNPASFSLAIATMSKHATKEKLPNWTDVTTVAATVRRLTAEVRELKEQLDSVKRELEDLKNTVDELNQRVDELERSPSPSPTTAASPSPSPAPSASASPTATPTPPPVYDLDESYSPTDNPTGPFEYVAKIGADYKEMKEAANLHGRTSWIAFNKETGEVWNSAYMENRIAGNGVVDLRPELEHATGFRFTAPQDGTVKLKLTLELLKATGNGLKLEVHKDSGRSASRVEVKSFELLPGAAPLAQELSLAVKAGDRLTVTVGAKGDSTDDEAMLGARLSY